MNYPNGKPFKGNKSQVGRTYEDKPSKIDYGGRGMSLESDIELSNSYYLNHGVAVIHKKPTPVQIVNVRYPMRSKAVINEAYFRTPSTTDYNGIYNGHYLDFEAKETKNKTSFPLNNMHEHQVLHMEACYQQSGIVFLLIGFKSLNEVYLLPYSKFKYFWDRHKKEIKKSITVEEIRKNGYYIPYQYQPRLNYIIAVDKLILDESEDRV
ncbi:MULTISPECIES: Holliday junction resolvase RecU [Staphylococcus]|uniref:Holliday junction resolvase RecU n=1 Tax=Staphylococcus succinus TaxID=61015 RepID=A0ABX5IL69_9STAP|nr:MULTISPECIES: Holliday junction resolvase RecU [Staphylococcus]MDH9160061.1 Holliday junction resolvase RecU [Staphylococcus succinus]MEB8124583.1 Holliday junction resolvase RecU [Staphylococcus succinus]OIJ29493.1 Holliday junction resolvase RecU [Staphylococcus sp. LCT-H4]PNZ17595.1 Holliday junction resolvase RecU [Staphylococcus succinus subsp. succinus]PTI68485.1 Holliday junction resolvase RecU [Staphylococcus succinus]